MREHTLDGATLSLDDLVGYTKLQDVLAAVLRHLGGQEAAIKQLRQDTEEAARLADRRLCEVAATLGEFHEKLALAEEWARSAEAAASSIALLQTKLDGTAQAVDRVQKDVTLRVEAVEKSMVALPVQLSQEVAATAELISAQCTAAERRIAALEARKIPDIEPLQKQSEAAKSRIDGLEGRLRDLARRVTEAEQLAAERPEPPPPGVDEETVNALEEALRALVSSLQRALEGRLEDHEARFRDIGEKITAAVEASKAAAIAEEARGRLELLLESLKAELQAVQEATGRELRVLCDQEAQDATRLTREVRELHTLVNSSMSKSAAATARCLVCAGESNTRLVTSVVGQDGKVYRRSPISHSEEPGLDPPWLDAGRTRTPHGKPTLQGGAGSGLRKYKTWTGEDRFRPVSASTPLLPGLASSPSHGREAVIELLRSRRPA